MKTLVAAFVGLALISGCHLNFNFHSTPGSGNRVKEVREVSQFRTLKIKGSADVQGHVGEPQSLTVEIDDNLIDIISTDVQGDTLTIASEESYSSRGGLKVEMNVQELDGVIVQGSGDINLDGIQGESFRVDIAGSGDVVATGDVTTLIIKIRGSGDVDLRGLHAQHVEVSISGSGDVKIHANDSLKVTIRGSGDVRYSGNPSVTKSIRGSGDINRLY